MQTLIREIVSKAQKETDDKWKENVGECLKGIENIKRYNVADFGGLITDKEGRYIALDQATNIIKEVIKNK